MRHITRLWSGQRKLYAEYSLLALAVMLPLLRPGYIFALDMVFAPKLRAPTQVNNQYVFGQLLHLLNYVLPSQVIQKLLLCGLLVLCGVGAHVLSLELRPASHKPLSTDKHKELKEKLVPAWGGYFAGVLYMINPFVYSRFMTGQYLVIAGYALMPFFIRCLWRFLRNPGRDLAVQLSLWALLISLLSIHSIFFMALVGLLSAVAFYPSYRPHWRRVAGWGMAAMLVWVLASSYWLIPLARGTTADAQLLNGFDHRFAENFQTATDRHYGVVYNAASLHGFWGDREARYAPPTKFSPLWPLVFLFIMALAVLGAAVAWRRRHRAETAVLLSLGLVSVVLGLGIAYKPLAPFYYWMVRVVPLYKGFREPQKFIGLLALMYVGLGSVGVDWLIRRAEGWKGRFHQLSTAVPTVLLLLPVLYTPVMLWGFSGQLRPSNYPDDWYSLNRRLNTDKTDFKLLYFPWHAYLSYDFSRTVIANPAPVFFDKPVIAGDNIEFGNIFRQSVTPATLYVEQQILRPHFEISDAGQRLEPLKVKYIVVSKNTDIRLYDFLDKQSDLKLISDTATLKVYQNQAFQTPKGTQ